MKRCFIVSAHLFSLASVTFLCLSPAMGQSAYFSLEGDLNTIADQHDFLFDLSRSVGSGEDLRFVTYTNQGGTNAAGDAIAQSFFDSVLELFDSLAASRGFDDDGGAGLDSLLSWPGVAAFDDVPLNPDPLLADSYRLNLSDHLNNDFGPWAVDLIGPANAIIFTGATPTGTSTIDSLKFGTTGGGTAVYNHIGGTLDLLDRLVVANTGDATLNVSAGGVVSNAIGIIGKEFNFTGVVTVTGSGSEWSNSGDLLVGGNGDGTLNVEAGGVVSNSVGSSFSGGVIGSGSGSTSVATVTGPNSQWNSSSALTVGNNGQGTLNVTAGGVVSNINGNIGGQTGGTGVATVSGIGSEWNNSLSLEVGRLGDGTLNVEEGGVVSNTEGIIGSATSATGVATVSGAGSEWNSSFSAYPRTLQAAAVAVLAMSTWIGSKSGSGAPR